MIYNSRSRHDYWNWRLIWFFQYYLSIVYNGEFQLFPIIPTSIDRLSGHAKEYISYFKMLAYPIQWKNVWLIHLFHMFINFFFQIKFKFYDGTYSSSCYSCIIWCRLFYKKIIRYQQWWGYHHSQQMSFILTSLKISIHNLIGRPIWIMEYASNPVKWKKNK